MAERFDIDEILETNSALQVEAERLRNEVTRLNGVISDLSYGKLEPGVPSASPENIGDIEKTLTALATIDEDLTATMIPNAILGLVEAGKNTQARQMIGLALRLSPKNPDLHVRWVRHLRCAKQFNAAMDVCNAAFGVDGDVHALRLNRGYLLYEAGYYKEAADDLEVAGSMQADSIEERLVAASARNRVGARPKDDQASLMAKWFKPEEATFSAAKLDPAQVKRSLAKYGCAWIKGLFKQEDLREFDRTISRNVEGMTEVWGRLGLPSEAGTVGFPLYFAAEGPEKAHAVYEQSYPGLFNPDRMADADNEKLPRWIFNNMRRVGLDRIIREHLKMPQLYASAAACHIRSMVPQGMTSFGEFHQDNRLYSMDAEILTLWFPFRYEHGVMPSLEFLPVRSQSHLPCVSVCGIHNDMLDPKVFWRPHYELGDAVLLSGFNPHRTYFESHMTKERTSIDFRIFATPLPAAIYEAA